MQESAAIAMAARVTESMLDCPYATGVQGEGVMGHTCSCGVVGEFGDEMGLSRRHTRYRQVLMVCFGLWGRHLRTTHMPLYALYF